MHLLGIHAQDVPSEAHCIGYETNKALVLLVLVCL